MSFCLPKELTQPFLDALDSGKLDIDKLASPDTSSEVRRAEIAKVVGDDNAKEISALFESKLLLKDQEAGLIRAIKSIGGLNPETEKSFINKVLKFDRVLDPSDEKKFLSDVVAQKMGTQLTSAEWDKITGLAQKAQVARELPTKNMSGVSDEYLKAADDLRDYTESLKPISAGLSIGKNAAIIARNNLLLNGATPLKSIEGQIVNSVMDMASRRIGSFSLTGENFSLAREANAEAWKTFRATGRNTAAMESLEDVGKLGEGKRFDQPSGMVNASKPVQMAESLVRNVAKYSNKVAIDWEHNIAFTKFYQKAFFDMGNVFSSNIARTEGLKGVAAKTRAAEIFKDSVRIKPQTDVGAMVRLESQKQAARITSTNDTYTARLALGVKDALNKSVSGLGDALMPIAKIPANIIWNGIENAGVGIPEGVIDIFKGRAKIQSSDFATRYEGMAQYANGIQKVARTVGTISAAAYFASQLTKNDFKTDPYGNHFVKIGNTWIDTEYISAISPALSGMMTIRQNAKPSDGVLDTGAQYIAGAAEGLKGAPGVGDLEELVNSITNSNYAKGIQKYATTFFTSRGVPAFIPNLLSKNPARGFFLGAEGAQTQAEVEKRTKPVYIKL